MIAAIVWSSMIETATDAPMPTESAPVAPPSTGSALVVVVDADAAVTLTAPVPAFTFAAGPITATVSMRAIVSANEPATLTDPPPAPLVATAPMWWLPLAAMSAVTLTPFEPARPWMDASFHTFASVIATPAPIAALPLVSALPVAVDVASAASLECTVMSPPLVTLTAAGIVARALAFAIVSAIAAATLIGPADVDAAGVAVEPVPLPGPATASAWLRSPAI